jgi:hypothetical protein
LINFQASNTGLPFDFSFADDSPDPGTQVIFVDKGDGETGLGAGGSTFDHDWIIGFGAHNPYAIGISIAETTNPSIVDSIDVFDTSSSLLFSLSLEPLGEFKDPMFFGFISDDPIGSIRFDDNPAPGGKGLGSLTAVVPVPAAVWLFGSGLLGFIGIARRKKAI